jgi:hypothetical protein
LLQGWGLQEEINSELKSDTLKRLANSWVVGWESLKTESFYEVHGFIRSNTFNNFTTGEILHCHENPTETALREPLIIINLSLPPRIKYGVNSGGSPVISIVYGFLLSQE